MSYFLVENCGRISVCKDGYRPRGRYSVSEDALGLSFSSVDEAKRWYDDIYGDMGGYEWYGDVTDDRTLVLSRKGFMDIHGKWVHAEEYVILTGERVGKDPMLVDLNRLGLYEIEAINQEIEDWGFVGTFQPGRLSGGLGWIDTKISL